MSSPRDFGNKLTGREFKDALSQGGDRQQIMDDARGQGAKIGKRTRKINRRMKAKERAQAVDNSPADQGGTPMQPAVEPYGSYGDYNSKGSVGINGNLEQSIGKQGDMDTTIGDNNTFGPGSNIGNDYSVTIGGQGVGANDSNGGGGTQFNNMMSAQAYNALNDNAWAKSQSQINGYSRSAGAIEQAEKQTGATDRVATLYNMTGADQKYWNDKATAHQGDYLGDIFKIRAPDWTMPDKPNKIEDKTEEITEEMSNKIEDV